MNYAPTVTSSWTNRALDIAAAQGTLASSPAEHGPNGQTVLCAASCIAYAGLVEADASEAASFLRDLARRRDKAAVSAAYQRLGLSAELAEATMARNDSTAPAERVSLLAGLLDR